LADLTRTAQRHKPSQILFAKTENKALPIKNGKTAIKAERDKVSEFKNGLAAVGV